MPAGAVPDAAATLFTLVRMIRTELGCNTTCGASNIAFGLPDRPTLGATFLSMAIGAGMTCAITNALEPEIKKAIMAANLMMGHDENCMAWISAHRDSASDATGLAAAPSAADTARAERE